LTDLPCPTQGVYWCEQDEHEALYVCDANLKWQFSASCGRTSAGYGCCKAQLPGIAWCDCRGLPGGPPALVEDRSTTAIDAPVDDARTMVEFDLAGKPCNVTDGYVCEQPESVNLFICGADYKFHLSATCGRSSTGQGCCKNGSPGTAWCDCRSLIRDLPSLSQKASASGNHALVGSDATIATTEKRTPATLYSSISNTSADSCEPGKFWCETPGWDWIIVCNQSGKWERSAYCGKTSEHYGW
jgi:hypothetical protein